MRPRGRRLRGVVWIITLVACGSTAAGADEHGGYPIRPVPFTAVQVADEFWLPRLETNRTVTIPYAFDKCEQTGRIANFARAGGLEQGDFEGIYYNDSDVFKVVEGACYALALHPDPKLDRYLDDLIAKIAAAQEDDGYLYTARTLNPDKPPKSSGPTRWSYLAHSHELYNVGHLYEAAVAHHMATGKRSLLDVALKSADLVVREFGPGRRPDVPGHQEIELGLARLYRLTGNEDYLRLAKFFLDGRGRAAGRELYGVYSQDHRPVVEQDHPVGHAVRAVYMYCGMADVATLTGDEAYIRAIDRIWHNMVAKRLYVTGGIGARRRGEAFGDDYELPNASAYCETCAAVANALWNQRMFLLHGDAKYIDVLERVLYNGLLSGVDPGGQRFFYPNPLASDGDVERQPWFGCACCPTNMTRFLPSVPGYVYAQRGDEVYVNLFIGGRARIPLSDQVLRLAQETRYPWDGLITIKVEPERAAAFALHVRVPGWVLDRPVPSDLYHYAAPIGAGVSLSVNGAPDALELHNGYARITRTWQAGDVVELRLPMPIRRVYAHPKVTDDAGRVALERGPIVYCVEGADHQGHVHNLVLPDEVELSARHQADLLGGVTTLHGTAQALFSDDDGQAVRTQPVPFTAVPYYAWCQRGAGEMAVWLAREPRIARPLPPPTLASTARASASYRGDGTLRALNDRLDPENSNDHSIPRFTWWDHRGTSEWVQYDFDQPQSVRRVEIYWFDDTGAGHCRVPASWRVLYKHGDGWQAVTGAGEYGTQRDRFNAAAFDAVETTSLRVEVTLQESFSGGILEWRVE